MTALALLTEYDTLSLAQMPNKGNCKRRFIEDKIDALQEKVGWIERKVNSSIEIQKGFSASHLHTQFDPLALKLTNCAY